MVLPMDDGNSTTTRLLTLLNVSAIKAGKRKRTYDDQITHPTVKLNKRKSVQFGESIANLALNKEKDGIGGDMEVVKTVENPTIETQDEVLTTEPEGTPDLYEKHFGTQSTVLSESSRDAVDRRVWKTSREKHGKLGSTIDSIPEGSDPNATTRGAVLSSLDNKLRATFKTRQAKQPQDQVCFQNDLLSTVSSHQDLYYTSTPWDFQNSAREILSLHVLNHVTKKRRRILKNNERLAHASKTNAPLPEDVQDQGFTRPSVLFLLPFRSSALNWVNALISHTPTSDFQIENHSRFLSEYSLPPGTMDKLASAEAGVYPQDHVETFKGNVDDNFRLGVKMTRKSVKLFAEFYGCDILIASPLGLRMSIEKEKNADFLSSIEIIVVDQMDALAMQNWEHVQFVFSNLNKLPKESHNTDFSRIKPWYLDGHAAYLRQTVLLSAYETPEMRSLFNTNLKNVAGKIRNETRWQPVQVPEGIDQSFLHFNCVRPTDEADKRFDYFTTQLFPTILKSAVQSTNTVIFIPSSFDFIRVHNYFRKQVGVTFTVLSEYSSNQDISRARQAFFGGKKSFMLISERFHFYRRYKIRGIRNLIFYGPPDHPQFYTELLSYPFLDDDVDASDVTCRVLYCKYDWFRLERVAGTEGVVDLIRGN